MPRIVNPLDEMLFKEVLKEQQRIRVYIEKARYGKLKTIIEGIESRAKEILSEKGYNPEEKDVIILQLENRPGALSKVAQKLKEEGIDIHYIYGTTSGKGERTTIVLSSDNNEKAEEVLKFVLSLSYWKK